MVLTISVARARGGHASYCDRFVELLIDLESQLPTRRYFNTLVDDHHVVVACQYGPVPKPKAGV